MEARTGKLVVLFVGAFVSCAIPPAGLVYGQPADASRRGQATGSLQIQGHAIDLRYAYARSEPGFFDSHVEDVHVLLSDVPLDEATRGTPGELARRARAGEVHALDIVIDAQGEPISGAIFDAQFGGMVSVAGMHRFEPAPADAGVIAGRLWMDGPRSFRDISYQYDATFSAAVPRPPTPEETAAQLASPAGRAAAAFLAAVLRDDLDAVRSGVSRASAGSFAGAQGERTLADLKADLPADTHLAALRTIDPIHAVATVQGTRNDVVIELELQIAMEDGAWKVTPP